MQFSLDLFGFVPDSVFRATAIGQEDMETGKGKSVSRVL